MVKHKLKTSNI